MSDSKHISTGSSDPYRSNLPGQQPILEPKKPFNFFALLGLVAILGIVFLFVYGIYCDIKRYERVNLSLEKRKQHAQSICGENHLVDSVDFNASTNRLHIICSEVPKKELKTVPWED